MKFFLSESRVLWIMLRSEGPNGHLPPVTTQTGFEGDIWTILFEAHFQKGLSVPEHVAQRRAGLPNLGSAYADQTEYSVSRR